MLSFKDGQPIAIITEGKYRKQKLKIVTDDDYINNGKGEKEIIFKDKIFPFPDTQKRQVIYICGQSGVGKSTLAGEYIRLFKKEFPKMDIYIFSRKKSEPAYDKYKPYYVPIDDDLIENPIDITEELKKGALVVFDDVNTISDDELRKAVFKIMADILEVGRSFNIYCIITSHLINSNEKSYRIIMNEISNIIIFPKACNRYGVDYALTKYFGMDKLTIKKILALKSKWAFINKNYPMYVLYEKGAFIV